ncbi:MAG: FprA family A-type flavoprotein [Clostridiales bacterium]|nr:FprA family A-type flavoprotein [Clostridiales bacterium]
MPMTDDIRYVGVNDREVDLFEGLYVVPNGVAYNSYVIMDEKIAVMDAVDARFGDAWVNNVREALSGRKPDYLVVHHMEPDHSAAIALFMEAFPEAVIVSSAKAFPMMKAFFGTDFDGRRIIVKEGDKLELGKHVLQFITAPMVHWPEVVMSYDACDKTLYSADGFGKFGALDAEEDWACEARRYYFGIVGKYGAQVQAVLKKASGLDIRTIRPLHGPVLEGEALTRALELYDIWSSYRAESEGVLIAYTSVYGHTRVAAEQLADQLRAKGVKVAMQDLARCDIAEAVEDAFRYDRMVLATTTYNADIFPPMRQFLTWLSERGYRNRKVGLIENGSWAPMAAKVMRAMLGGCKDVTIVEPVVKIQSALNTESAAQLDTLAEAMA